MYKKWVKRFVIYSLLSLIISSLLIFIYIFFPKLLDSIDSQMRDSMFVYRGEIAHNDNIVIVDIDEKSLASLGQWPWSRDKIARILDNLDSAAIVGLDIVFAESDRTSPSLILKNYNLDIELDDYDEVLSQKIASSPAILGYFFDLSHKTDDADADISIPAIFIESGKNEYNDFIPKANSAILNIESYQDSAYSSGFLNFIPDSSAIVRSGILTINYDDIIYPSLALEIVRIITDTARVRVEYDDNGVSHIILNEISIPTDRYAQMFINYRGAQKSFRYISASDIYSGDFDKELIDGKIVLIGTSATGLFDLRATPFDSAMAGVEVHANIIDNILSGDFIQKPSFSDGLNIVLIVFLTFLSVYLITLTPLILNIPIILALLGGFLYFNYYMLFIEGIILNIIFGIFAITVGSISSMVLDYFYNIKKTKSIRAKFASKVSKSVMEDILRREEDEQFVGSYKYVTIFFSDIRGFTNISEKLGAVELVKYLNRYMDPMSKIIINHSGTIDKYIGDAIMAYWNAPLDVEHHADEAVSAALEQLSSLEALNSEFRRDGLPPISIGIGINSGEVVVGEMGSVLRSDYTVIGDAINLGSRVESLCKFYGSTLNITHYTKELLKNDYIFRFLDRVRVKGKDESVEIYSVLLDNASGIDELSLYHSAIELYHSGQFSEALEIFLSLNADVKVYEIYIDRCREFIATPPIDFDGVYDHTTKG